MRKARRLAQILLVFNLGLATRHGLDSMAAAVSANSIAVIILTMAEAKMSRRVDR